MLPILKNIPKDKELKNRSRPQRCRVVRSADIEKMIIVSIFVSGNDSNEIMDKKLSETLYLIFDYPYKYYTFKLFEV